MVRLVAALCVLFSLVGTAGAATLSPQDRADIARAEAYLNGLRSLRAKFVQESSGGGFAEGTVYISRPGRLRLDYAPPAEMQVYADGFWLIYVDTELEQVTHVPLGSTLADFLVRKNIRLSGDVTVTNVERERGMIRFHLVRTEEPDAGALVLNFSDSPFALRNWNVTDAQGVTTRVSLIAPEINVSIAEKVFHFDASKYETPTWE